jgi:HSP20 family protein
MNLMQYEPWSFLNQIQNEVNKALQGRTPAKQNDSSTVETSQWLPAVDIKEEQNRFVLFADVPGVDPKDIEVTMENQILTIKGQRETESKEETDNYSRVERVKGLFYRRFTLPDSADGERIVARSHQGVLEIEIPKKEQSKPRRISVNVKEQKNK